MFQNKVKRPCSTTSCIKRLWEDNLSVSFSEIMLLSVTKPLILKFLIFQYLIYIKEQGLVFVALRTVGNLTLSKKCSSTGKTYSIIILKGLFTARLKVAIRTNRNIFHPFEKFVAQ